MKNKQVYQGSFDMLCGVYCAAHLIACFKVMHNSPENQSEFYDNAAETAFYKLMIAVESVDKGRMFTAIKLFEPDSKRSGFNDKQLARIINHLSSEDREHMVARAFSSAKLKGLVGSKKRGLFSAGARAIVNEAGEDHWITAEGKHRDGGRCSFDPSDGTTKRLKQINWEKGVFLAPPSVFEF